MTIVAVADTHAALWYLYADIRLSSAARTFIDQTAAERQAISVSTISLVEIAYLIEKGRVQASAYEDITQALTDPGHVFVEAPLMASVADSLRQVPRDEVPDMSDRIVAATALHLGVSVLSRDRRLRFSTLQTIW